MLDRAAAIAGWPKARVHGYIGEDLFAGAAVPASATSVESLRSYLVLTFDAPSGPYGPVNGTPAARCGAAARILPRLSREGYVFHPYPVTPLHPDFLEHSDIAGKARARYAEAPRDDGDARGLAVRARGPLAAAILPASAGTAAREWDATLEEIDVERLLDTRAANSGRSPWSKDGWYQAYLLYAGQAGDAKTTDQLARIFYRLEDGDYRSETERINLERTLASGLAQDCHRVVVGYTLRREYFNSEYSLGVENVGFDSQLGLLSPLFPRTVKLKDFPWNGWLRIGVATGPEAAWNPIGGLNDLFGRALWAAIGDPALLPAPHGGAWIDNRVHVTATRGPVAIPADARKPEPGTGRLVAVGKGQSAQARLRYAVVTSAFHDGTHCDIADLVYAYVFASQWRSNRGAEPASLDPAVAPSAERIHHWLAGFKVVGEHTQTRNYGDDLKFNYRVLMVDVYLKRRLSDSADAAALVPPWSTLPWQLLVLMEEAVARGIAAFGPEQARRRGVPWLDLVRDPGVGARLASLVDEFQREGYRPQPLRGFVGVQDARERWAALARFYAEHHHFLVTNGPYRLEGWNTGGAVLQVFRDASYPRGVGEFDAYAIALRGYVSGVADRGDRLELGADIDQIVRAQRSYEIERIAFVPSPKGSNEDAPPRCHYVIVGPGASVVRAGDATLDSTGRFVIELKHLGAPGLYTVAAAVFVGGNTMEPNISFIQHRVEGRAAARQEAARDAAFGR